MNIQSKTCLGALSVNDVRSQGEGGLSSADKLGLFSCDGSKIYNVSALTRKGRGELVKTFCRQGERGQFSRFCADVFHRRPLMKRKLYFAY